MGDLYYKFLVTKGGKLKSHHGNHTWEVGKKYTAKGELIECANGFHASKEPLEALGYVKGDVLALVKVSKERLESSDKACFRSMKVIESRPWTKGDSVALAVYAAELVLDIFEAECPGDNRPRKAIEAAKNYLANPTFATRSAYAAYDAAYDAYDAASDAASDAARAASDAAYAAYAAAYAAYAAYAAAYAASDAARAASDAARAAYDAARAAYDAAYAAVDREALKAKLNQWIKDRLGI